MEINNLEKEGFVSVKYTDSLRKAVEEAMSSWQRFCQLSDDKKRILSGGDRIQDFGYMRRQDKGERADDKELFHASIAKMAILEEKARAIGDERATSYIRDVGTLIREIKPLIVE